MDDKMRQYQISLKWNLSNGLLNGKEARFITL